MFPGIMKENLFIFSLVLQVIGNLMKLRYCNLKRIFFINIEYSNAFTH
jgi:hypothetical protein